MIIFDTNTSFNATALPVIAKMFGAKRVSPMYYDVNDDRRVFLWFANFNPNTRTGWNNVLMNDFSIIEMNNSASKQQEHFAEFVTKTDFDQIRFTFGRWGDKFRFLGIYMLDRDESVRMGQCCWCRLSDFYILLDNLNSAAAEIADLFER